MRATPSERIHQQWKRRRAIFRALEKVELAAVAVTNEVTIEVEEPYWTDRERALMRAIERYEDLTLGRARRGVSARRGAGR